MPFSHNALDPVVAAIFQQLNPESLLDIGPGAGKYGVMMRTAETESGLKCRKIAVEINPEYVTQFNLSDIYDEVWVKDAGELVLTQPDLSGDMVVWGDCIEHLPKSRGIDLIEYLLYRFRQIVIIFPIDLPQGAWEGHVREAHVSLWYPEDFQRYKASSCISETKEGYSMCLVLMNGVFVPPNERVRLEISGTNINIVEG